MLCLLALALSPRLTPRARLHVVARGSTPFDQIQSQIDEVAQALARLTKHRSCTEEEGCLVVDISWRPAEEGECATGMSMSLVLAPPPPAPMKLNILKERIRAMREES